MNKVLFKQAYAHALKLNKKLLATDPRLNKGGVFMINDDGSSFFWNNAFIVRWRGYLLIFTEHHGFMVYDNDDAVFIAQIARNKKTKA